MAVRVVGQLARRGTIQEDGCDFVLLDREWGVLFVEVKGGSLVFEGWQWSRDVRGAMWLVNKDTFAQATQCTHEIIDLVERRFRRPGVHLRRGGGVPRLRGLRDAGTEHPAGTRACCRQAEGRRCLGRAGL